MAPFKEVLFKAGLDTIGSSLRLIARRIKLRRLFPKKVAICPITPEQIYDAASYVPALRRADVFRQYLGLRVNWFTTLRSARRESGDDNHVHLQLRSLGEAIAMETTVFCTVEFSRFPELINPGERSPIRVIGRINKIEEAGITLGDVELILGQWTSR
jgi:hypothetical protein